MRQKIFTAGEPIPTRPVRSSRRAAAGRGNDRPAAGGRIRPPQPEEHEVAARDELAKNAGVASFGLTLTWQRARRDSRGYRAR